MALSEPMFIVLITSISDIVMKLISMCYKSKCATFQCWGINITRDVFIEEEYDEKNLQKNDSAVL